MSYSLQPEVPGLPFAVDTRTLSGTPVGPNTHEMTYRATDADGDTASLSFTIEIRDPLVFWTDFESGKIQRANLDGSKIEDAYVTEEFSEPHGIAIDTTGNKMYWTEHNTRKIQRANLDGSEAEILLTTDAAPRAITLNIDGGKLYLSTGHILSANLDGSDWRC